MDAPKNKSVDYVARQKLPTHFVSFHYPGRRTAILFWAVYHPSNAVK